jgi:two-component system sensor histidine kinase DegS
MTRWSSSPVISECDMNNFAHRLARYYAATLRKYLADGQEAVLAQAYELGRLAIAEGSGVLDMARTHQEALGKLLRSPAGGRRSDKQILKAAETFFLEALSPFEATHRGFSETNVKLQERNRELEAEIGERKRAEDALRQSERHYQRLFKEAQDMQENLRSLSNEILRTQEEERKRISRELHDEVGQSLTAISVTLATLNSQGTGNSSVRGQKLAEAQAMLQETMETIHRFARDLRPAALDELGLLPALRSFLKGFAGRTGLRVHFRGDPAAEKLEDDQKIVVFRIAQECLTNVSKHAQAGQVEVVIRRFKDGICMEVADDGRSFTADPINFAKSKGRLGLLGMQERVRLVNGQFMVKPQPGKGTTVRVVIPFRSTSATMVLPPALDRRKDESRFVRA